MTGQLGQLSGVYQSLTMSIKGLEQTRGETARRTQARSRGDIRECRDFDLRRFEIEHLDCFANDGMNHILRQFDMLQSGVLQKDSGCERSHDRHVDISINGSSNEKASVVAIVRRQIGAATTQRDAQRATRNDHMIDRQAYMSC